MNNKASEKIKIAVTGHIALINENKVREDIILSFDYFQEVYKGRQLQAISALAAGADTIFAEEANKLEIPVQYLLPFELADYKDDFKPRDLLKLEDLLAKNNQQYEIVTPLSDSTKETRNEAYWAVGKRLVDDADILLAVWDGESANGKGGTGDVVACAHSIGKEVHIVKGVRKEIAITEEEKLFDKLDTTAKRHKQRFFQPVWYFGLFLAVLGVAFFAIGLVFPEKAIENSKMSLVSIEILCIILSAILIIFVARRFKKSFLENRRNAEYLRTVLAFRDANIPLPKIKLEDEKDKPTIEIEPYIIDFENRLVADNSGVLVFEDSKRKLWSFAHKQVSYQEDTRRKPAKAKVKNIHKAIYILTWIFYSSLAIKVMIELQHFLHEKQYHLPYYELSFLLPFLNFLLIVTPSALADMEMVG